MSTRIATGTRVRCRRPIGESVRVGVSGTVVEIDRRAVYVRWDCALAVLVDYEHSVFDTFLVPLDAVERLAELAP